jgi:hypothetical protein
MENQRLLSLSNRMANRIGTKAVSNVGLLSTVLLITVTLFTIPSHAVAVSANVNLIPAPERQQAEPTIAIDLQNPSIIAAGAQDYNFAGLRQHRWNAIYRSSDAGQTWTNSLLPGFPGDSSAQGLSSPLHGYTLTSDPVLAFDNRGNLYYAGIAVNLQTFNFTAYVAVYVNNGANYSFTTLLQGFNDFPQIAIDTTGGASDGNVYITATNGLYRSTNGGATFSTPLTITGMPTDVKVGSNGNVYVTSTQFPTRGSGPTNILVSKFTDGGVNVHGHEIAAHNITTIPDVLPGNQFREFSLPEMAVDSAGVYVTWADFRTGNSDVLFVRSLDDGETWSNPITVNDVTIGQQFSPTIAAAQGIISIAWYDDRLSINPNGTIDALDVFYAMSSNSGQTFTPNTRVTSVSFNPNQAKISDFARGSPFLGDYISMATGPGFVKPIWSDDRNACDFIDPNFGCVDEDIFTATITL